MRAPRPDNEEERLAALERTGILDTPPEASLDDLTLLAAHLCGTPTALISFVDADRQWFKSKVGWAVPESSREVAFCAHAICDPDGELIVDDATRDPRFRHNPLVVADPPHIRFYAGMPLTTSEGLALGTLCVIDREPRTLTADQLAALRALRRTVVAELELRRSRADLLRARAGERLGSVLANMSDGYVAFDREWRYVDVNPRAAAMFGCKAEELIGRRYLEAFPEARDSTFHRAYARAMAGEAPIVFESHYPPWQRWFENRIYGTSDGIAVFFNDVTERRRAQDELREAHDRFARIFYGAPEPMSISDVGQGTLFLVNDAFCAAFGYAREELVGRSAVDLGLWSAPGRREALVRTLQANERLRGAEGRVRLRSGEQRDVVFSGEILATVDGPRLLLMFIDVTERRRAEATVRAQSERLEELSRRLITAQEEERAHVARELHDEIGQLLTAVRLDLKVVERHLRAPQKRAAVAECLGAVESAIAQVRSLSLDLRPPLLDDLGLAAALRWLAGRQSPPVHCTVASEVDAVPAPLALAGYRVAQEALTNVARHAQAGRVTLDAGLADGRLTVVVSDDGRGFAADERAASGGLGLVGMRERVALAGGTLAIRSVPGQGTTVRADFPVKP